MAAVRVFAVVLLSAASLWSQAGPDERIATELAGALKLLEPDTDGAQISEEEATARAEQFQNVIEALIAAWEPLASELGTGRFALARAQVLSGDPAAAVPHFRAFLAAHAGHADAPDAHVGLGAALLDGGQAGEAATALRKALEDPKNSGRRIALQHYLALAELELGHPEAALALFEAVHAEGGETPFAADAALKKLELLRDLLRIDEARAWHATLSEAASDAPWLAALGEELQRLNTEAPEFVDVQAWLHGEASDLASLRGKVVVLNFFADRYPACKVALEELASAHQQLGADDVVFIGLTRWYRPVDRVPLDEQKKALEAWLGERGVRFPVLVSKGFDNLRRYGVRAIPHTVIIDRAGQIRWIDVGASEGDRRSRTRLMEVLRRVRS